MDLLKKVERSRHYGSEFLTWLLFRSMKGDGAVQTEKEEVELAFEMKVKAVDPGKSKEQDTFKGEHPAYSREAIAALSHGKLFEEASLAITRGEKEWKFNFNGPRWNFSGIKLPALLKEAGDDRILERFFLLEELHATMENLYAAFLELRLDPEQWAAEKTAFHIWLRNAAGELETCRNDSLS